MICDQIAATKGALQDIIIYNVYKEHIGSAFNSQVREQTHGLIQKMAPSLRYMNYKSFMIVMRIFVWYEI